MREDTCCRLCLTDSDLVWIFDSRIEEPDNMREVIQITTGVEIKSTDQVTQKICKRCCQITMKMFKFRSSALANDKELKARMLKAQKNTAQIQETMTRNTVDRGSTECLNRITVDHNVTLKLEQSKDVESPTKAAEIASTYRPHETVTRLLHAYPHLKIPRSCLKSNLFPDVAIDKNAVNEWFAKKRTNHVIESKTGLSPTKNSSQDSSNEKKAKLIVKSPSSSEVAGHKRKLSSESVASKRKFSSDTISICSSDPDRDEIFSHLGLTEREKNTDVGEPELLSQINKSTNVNVCTICNAVTYSNKEMKLHSRKHMSCPFCKVRFRTMDAKNIHVDKECPIKSIMQNLPSIPLMKIDQAKNFSEKYPNAFDYIQVLSSDDEGDCSVPQILIADGDDDPLAVEVNTDTPEQRVNVENNSIGDPKELVGPTDDVPKCDVSSSCDVQAGYNQPIEQIDITVDDDVMYISDDEISPKSPKDGQGDVEKPVEANEMRTSQVLPLIKIERNDTVQEPATKVENSPKSELRTKVQEKSVKLPVFTIPNDPYLDSVNAETSEKCLIKALLKEADKCHTLTPPTNKSITIQGNHDKIYALTNIVHYLRRYKVPVDLSFNNKLTVAYEPLKTSAQYNVVMWDPSTARYQRNMIPLQPTGKNDQTTNLRTILPKSPAAKNDMSDLQLSMDKTPVTHSVVSTETNTVTSNQLLVSTTKSVSQPVRAAQTTVQYVLPSLHHPQASGNHPRANVNHPQTSGTHQQISVHRPQTSGSHLPTSIHQHHPQTSTRPLLATTIDARGPSNVTVLNSAIHSNPLLNQTLNRPVVNSVVYRPSNVSTVTSSGVFTPGGTNPSNVSTSPALLRPANVPAHHRPPVIPQRFKTVPTPSPYPSFLMRPPPPNYRPAPPPRRIPDTQSGVRAPGLRVRTADELNQKF